MNLLPNKSTESDKIEVYDFTLRLSLRTASVQLNLSLQTGPFHHNLVSYFAAQPL